MTNLLGTFDIKMKELAQQVIETFPKITAGSRAMLGADAAAILMECVAKTNGDYIEIGSAVGGSAVMAASAMRAVNRPGTVYCIDPFGCNNALDGVDRIYQMFWLNIMQCRLQQRIVPFKQYHPPFPDALQYHQFSVGLIDGSHVEGAPLRDYASLNKRVTDYLLFDNVEKEGVKAAVDKALQNDEWKEYKSIEYESNYEEDKIVKFVALGRNKEKYAKVSEEISS